PSTPALVLLMALAWVPAPRLIHHGTHHRCSACRITEVAAAVALRHRCRRDGLGSLMVVLAIVLSLIVGYR
ncbi:MAG: hypothetical protein IPI02_17225, partial [Sterolibacteriaceae bacterium]|nr:hypothetical protein [Sterolibacteriaceae bacterium]